MTRSSPSWTAAARPRAWVSHALLLLTAAIWGLGFVAQRAGMAYIGPFAYNAARFALGTAALEALLRRRARPQGPTGRSSWWHGWLLGGLLFTAASLQQIGLVSTTAGKAGFITGLYVVLVPLLSSLAGRKVRAAVWVGAGLAVAGLYLLSVTDAWRVERGDVLVLGSAFFWALHVLAVDRFVGHHDSLRLAAHQFWVVAVWSAGVALVGEQPSWAGLWAALPAILYGGLVSVGVGYTLQVVAQRHAEPGLAAIILSLEAVFALLGGVILLGETLTSRGLLGAGLMLAGMVLAQRGATTPEIQNFR